MVKKRVNLWFMMTITFILFKTFLTFAPSGFYFMHSCIFLTWFKEEFVYVVNV